MKLGNSLSSVPVLLRSVRIKKYVIPLTVSLILLMVIYTYGEGLGYREKLKVPVIGFKNYYVSDNGTVKLNFIIKGQAHFILAEALIVNIGNDSIVYRNLTTTNTSIKFSLDPPLLAKMCFNNEIARVSGTIRLVYLNYTLRLHLNEIHVRYPCNISLHINVSEDKVIIYGPEYSWLRYAPLKVNAIIRSIAYVNGVPRVVEFKKLELLYNGEPLIIYLKPYDKIYVSLKYMVSGRTVLRTQSYVKK